MSVYYVLETNFFLSLYFILINFIIRIGLKDSRIGFAGPAVILNTMCEANQAKFDSECPADFQSASYLEQYGQIDFMIDSIEGEDKASTQTRVQGQVGQVAALLMQKAGGTNTGAAKSSVYAEPTEADINRPFNYLNSREMTRPQAQG